MVTVGDPFLCGGRSAERVVRGAGSTRRPSSAAMATALPAAVSTATPTATAILTRLLDATALLPDAWCVRWDIGVGRLRQPFGCVGQCVRRSGGRARGVAVPGESGSASRNRAPASSPALPRGLQERARRSLSRAVRASAPAGVAVPPAARTVRAPAWTWRRPAGPPAWRSSVSCSVDMTVSKASRRACASVAPAERAASSAVSARRTCGKPARASPRAPAAPYRATWRSRVTAAGAWPRRGGWPVVLPSR